jgi:uroporphyrinogen decarboxylase
MNKAAPMTSRERVLTALQHQEPDRVPTALGGGPYGVVDALYFQLLERLKLGDPVPPFRRGHNISYMDDRLLERLGTDTRYVWPGALPNSPTRATSDPNTFIDGYGQTWKRALPYYYADRGILTEATGIEDIDRIVHWPDPSEPVWSAGVRERAQALREGTDTFVVGRMVASHGVFQTACDLRGTEQFLMDMATHPAFALHLLERITDALDGLLKSYLEAGGRYFDMVELPGDDYAGNTNLVISPAMFRRFIKPSLQRLVHTIRSFRSEIKVMLHSDGRIERLLPDLIEVGIEVVHPLEPLPAMDLTEIKARYGDRLSFLGGIDIARALPGSVEDVIHEVKLRIEQLAPGGGYIVAPANHIQADVPGENVIALFEAARKFGQYPLQRSPE